MGTPEYSLDIREEGCLCWTNAEALVKFFGVVADLVIDLPSHHEKAIEDPFELVVAPLHELDELALIILIRIANVVDVHLGDGDAARQALHDRLHDRGLRHQGCCRDLLVVVSEHFSLLCL